MPYGNTKKKKVLLPQEATQANTPNSRKDRREYYKTYIRMRRAEREASGVCRECGNLPLMPNTNLCEECWWYRLVKVWCPSLNGEDVQKTANQLKQKLIEQRYQCAYTGWNIELATTAQIDHILPLKTHPQLKDDISNMQWVHKDINLMKGGRTRQEFVDLCILIVERAK